MNEKNKSKIVYLILSIVEAYIVVYYMRLSTTCIIAFPVAGIIFYCHLYKMKMKAEFRKNRICYYLYSVVFSVVIILCKHMIVNFDDFYSNIFSNYILEFKWNDFICIFILIHVFSAILFRSISLISSGKLDIFFKDEKFDNANICTGISGKKNMFLISLGIFMCWLPYFVKYYPGLIYGDSTISLLQIFGKIPYNNHHPVAYTLFIKICMAIGSFVGDNTVGVAIYTIFQMIFMSIIFSYSICWLRNKGISKIVCLVVMGFYALPGFWAQHAISMWKDPLFSALVFFFSLMLFDIIYSNGKVINEKRFRIRCVLCVLGISFLRNNGIYVVAFSIALLICCSFVKKGKWMINKSFLFLMMTSIILVYIVQGPIYAIMKIETDPVEAYGIPLQQVARTVVYEGDMSKDEKKFINDIMPLEKYVENYSPGLVDHLKWSNEFNKEFFNKHQDKFVKVWLSLMIKNPKIYLEAWALNTCGFWGINYWELNGFKKNITMGVPRGEELKEAYQINVSNSKSDESQGVFSLSTPMPAVALCLWIALGMIVFALVNRVPRYLILFIPCLGNILTLVLASPITYWPRYGLSFICLLPLCIVFPFIIKPLKKYENKKNIKQK